MDTLSHGLWGGAAFGQASSRAWKWAFWLGAGPDLLSFGPFFLTHMGDIGERWAHHRFGHPDPSIIPPYVYHAYNVTHSLVIWGMAFSLVWLFRRKITWPFAAWGLHILCDIPTHSIRFFPTPYLWPLRTPFYDGIPWARAKFMLVNYILIGLTYMVLAYRKRLSKR